MEKQRKEKGDKKFILKVFIKALILWIVTVGSSLTLLTLFLIEVCGGVKKIDTQLFEMLTFPMLPILVIYALIILYCSFKTFIGIEKSKISKKLVEDILSKDTHTEVYPKEGHLRYYHRFFYKELPAKSKYFAILSDDEKKIVITLKFNKDDECIFLEWIEKEDFKDAYEVVETDKTTN